MDAMVLNEVYFGESPRLKALQAQFTKFRSKYIGQEKMFSKYKADIMKDPELIKFNEMTAEFFGFKHFQLMIEPMLYNAYTFPFGQAIGTKNPKNMIRATADGFRYSREAEYTLISVIAYGLIANPEYSDRELIAILLHEIGHNFSLAASRTGGLYRGFMLAMSFINLLIAPLMILLGNLRTASVLTKPTMDLYAKAVEDLQKKKSILIDLVINMKNGGYLGTYIVYTVLMALSGISTLMNPISALLNNFYQAIQIPLQKLQDPGKLISLLFGYTDEKYADQFASMYGYGSELVTALDKLSGSQAGLKFVKNMYDEGIIGNLVEFCSFPSRIVSCIFDPHPEDAARAKAQLDYIDRELKKSDLSPAIKKELEVYRKKMEESINTIMDVDKHPEGQAFRVWYQKWLYENVQGDFRDILGNKNDRVSDDYDRTYEKIKNLDLM